MKYTELPRLPIICRNMFTNMQAHFQPLPQLCSALLRLESSRCLQLLGRSRYFSSSSSSSSSPNPPVNARLPPRWLSDIKARVGKCIIFGLQPTQVDEAGEILRVIARDWRELLAGSEGFLTGRRRAGLERHQVVWGEMVGGS